jgi:hypothetical protein
MWAMKTRLACALVLSLVGCKSPPAPTSNAADASEPAAPRPSHSGPKKERPESSASVEGTAPATSDSKESPKTAGLPAVDFGTAGPIQIQGYPKPLETGMRDYATLIGWTKDGDDVLVCGQMTPIGPAKGAELADSCYSKKRGAETTTVTGVEDGPSGPRVGAAFAADIARLKSAARSDLRKDDTKNELHPPPITQSWSFAKDLVIDVDRIDNALRVGGFVRGHDPVHPITLRVKSKIPDLTFDGAWNAIVVSPDSSEIAFVGHFFCMEWCNEIVITRMTTGQLASHIYNDTGFRLHQKKDYAASRDLFLKAAWADPRAPLPPYNLACAYALLGDEPNAEKALRLAIAVGGDKVKARAKKDADFAKVLGAKWFQTLTG